MKIFSYNVNGIRAAIKKGFLEWLNEYGPDIICIQEIKANTDQLDLDLFSKIGFAIDINKNKIGKFLPVSKIEIKNKEDFYKSVQSDDLLLISNPNYVDEIKEYIIKNTNIKFKIQSL